MCLIVNSVDSRQLVASPTELAGLVPRVGVTHFDVEADSDSGAQKLEVLLCSIFFRGRVCNAYDNYSRMHSLLCDMTACVICTYIYLCVHMSHVNAISHRDT